MTKLMFIPSIATAAIILFSLNAPSMLALDVQVANPSFETDTFEWTVDESDMGMSTIFDETSIRVADRSARCGSSLVSERLPAREGAGYLLRFEAEVLDGGGIGVYIRFFNELGALIDTPRLFYKTLNEQSAWAQYYLGAIAPPGTSEVEIWIHSYAHSTVTARFDNFLLKQIPKREAQGMIAPIVKSPVLDFPKPSPEQTFSEYKVYQSDGSILRTPVEDWEGARNRVKQQPQWQEWLKNKQEEVDAWIENHEDCADWQSGWYHNFVSPVDGAFLVWTDAIPGEEVDCVISKSGDRVEVTKDIFEGWVYGFRKRNFDKMVDAARLYQLTEDPHYAEWVGSQLDFYADNYEGWGNSPRQRVGSHLGWQALDDAVWLSRMVESARLVFDYAGEERRNSWFDHLFKPQAELVVGQWNRIHNIAMWFRSSAAQVALLYGDEDLWTRAVDNPYGLREQFRQGVTSDYFWYEQSIGYNDYVVYATFPLMLFAGLLGEGDRLEQESAVLQNLVISPYTTRFPDNRVPNPADSGGTAIRSASSLASIYRLLPTKAGLAHAGGIHTWDTLVDPPEFVSTEYSLPPVVPHLLESTRFAIIRDDPWQVFMHFGQLTGSHAQAEALNWSAYFGATPISQDAGTVGYGSPLSKQYYSRGLAHNVPLIGGYGQESWSPGTLVDYNADNSTVSALQINYRNNAQAERTLDIVKGTLVDTVTLRVKDSSCNEGDLLGLSLHLEGKLIRTGKGFMKVPLETFTLGRPKSFSYWEDVHYAKFTDSVVMPIEFPAGLVINVKFLVPGEFTLYIAQAPGQPPSRHTAIYIESSASDEATFVTTFTPVAEDDETREGPIKDAPPKKDKGFWRWLWGN